MCPLSTAPASAPTNVTAMVTSATSITVMWEEVPPRDQNGAITMYEVLYVPLETFDGAIGPLSVNVTENMTQYTITDLQDYVNYTIFVRAYTSVGAGPYGDGITVMTDEDGKLSLLALIGHTCFVISTYLSSY